MINVERLRRADEIVQAALEDDAGEAGQMSELLDAECAGDALLRAEVESLLGYRDRAKDFIETPAFALGAHLFSDGGDGDSAQVTGQRIGPFEVVSEIGRGGMGSVYLAKRADGEFEQQVAVKVIRQTLASSETRRHFKRERQILASLNHPNIARLLDGGVSAEGEPFLAMEYVEGVRIDRYAEAHQLSINARLNLFRQVCAAVQYAHQNLVIHRDLKPSNIIVTSEGAPKLLDFGIAKLLDPEGEDAGGHTVTELGVMTPEYASPEQVRGESVTTASDVYSLGVVLYELLAEHRPYRVKSRKPDEIARAICEQEPERPSDAATRRRSDRATEEPSSIGSNSPRLRVSASPLRRVSASHLKGDLDNIVLMAMRKEPARRYASVAQFSEDIRRHLDGLPVIARKDTFKYRSAKFIKRNKVGVAAAALVLLSLVGGIVATVWQARRATEQARVAAQERDRAERRFKDVRQLSNALLTDIAPKIERLQGSTEARQALVFQSLKYLDSLAQEAGGDLLLQGELASAYEKVGDLQGNPKKPNLGDFAGAISSYEKAQRIRRDLPETGEQERLLAENIRGLADIHRMSVDIKGALQDYAAAVKIYEKLLTRNPESYDLLTAYLKTKLELAEVHEQNTQFDMAASLVREIVAALERFDPNKQETRVFLATAYSQLGHSLSWDNKQSEAETEMAKATALADGLAAENPNDTNVRQAVYRVYMRAGFINETINNDRSLQFFNKALRIVERAIERDASDVQAKQNLAKTLARVGTILANLKKVSEAFSALEKAEKISLEILEREPMNRGYQNDLAVVQTHFGVAKYEQGDWQGALKAYQRTAVYYETIMQTDKRIWRVGATWRMC